MLSMLYMSFNVHLGALFVRVMQEDLQDKVAALQRQLTWLQSHASLQDNINKDLMEEVLHLRQAMASLSAVPPAESKSGKDTLAHHK